MALNYNKGIVMHKRYIDALKNACSTLEKNKNVKIKSCTEVAEDSYYIVFKDKDYEVIIIKGDAVSGYYWQHEYYSI